MVEKEMYGEFPLTVAGLEFSSTPLREFTAKLADIEFFKESERDKVKFKFSELEVIKSEQPYEFPTGDVVVNLSKKAAAPWGVLMVSLQAAAIAAGLTEEGQPVSIMDLVDKHQHWTATPRDNKDSPTRKPEDQVINWLEWEVSDITD